MKIVAVILNWNRAELAVVAARSVAAQVERVYLVDNGSAAPDRAALEAFAARNGMEFLALHRNVGYAGGNNAALRAALTDDPDAILILNNDAAAEPGAVGELAKRLAADARVGAVMPAVVDAASGRLHHTACALDEQNGTVSWVDNGLDPADVAPLPADTDWVSGEAFLARARVFRECGGFDERLFSYFEDVEWSVRVRRAGWTLEVVPAALVRHVAGGSRAATTAAFLQARNRLLFLVSTLGKSHGEAMWLSARPTVRAAVRSLRRGRPHDAAAAVAGWGHGAIRVARGIAGGGSTGLGP